MAFVATRSSHARLTEHLFRFSTSRRLKPKAGEISKDVAYFSGTDIEDLWVDYPW